MCDYYPLGYNWEAHISTQKHFCAKTYPRKVLRIRFCSLCASFIKFQRFNSEIAFSTQRLYGLSIATRIWVWRRRWGPYPKPHWFWLATWPTIQNKLTHHFCWCVRFNKLHLVKWIHYNSHSNMIHTRCMANFEARAHVGSLTRNFEQTYITN